MKTNISMLAFSGLVEPRLRSLAVTPHADAIQGLTDTVCKLSEATSGDSTEATPTLLPKAILTAGGASPPLVQLGRLCAVAGLTHQTFSAGNLPSAARVALEVARPFNDPTRAKLYQGAVLGLQAMAAQLGPAPIAHAVVSCGANALAVLDCVTELGNGGQGDLLDGFSGVSRVAKDALQSTEVTAEDALLIAKATHDAHPTLTTSAAVQALSDKTLSPAQMRGCLAAVASLPSRDLSLAQLPAVAKGTRRLLDAYASEEACQGALALLRNLANTMGGAAYVAVAQADIPARERLEFLASYDQGLS